MYQSYSFYANPKAPKPLLASMINAFKVSTGSAYFNYLDEKWKNSYSYDTISLIHCSCGEMALITQDEKYLLHDNEFLFIKFFDINNGTILSKHLEFTWINFTAQEYEKVFELNKIYHKSLTQKQVQALDHLFSLENKKDIDFGYLNTCFSLYLYSIMKENPPERPPKDIPQKSKLIDEMCSYIEQKLYSDITVTKIADFFNLSTRRVQQIFTYELNISPKKYITQRKMEESYRLVKDTSIPFYEIAEMLCFSSAYHFSRDFKDYFNETPTNIRKNK